MSAAEKIEPELPTCRLCEKPGTLWIGELENAYCEEHHAKVMHELAKKVAKVTHVTRADRRAEARKENKVRRLW